MASTPASWVMIDPAAALEFVLAGSLAEKGSLGHCLKEGWAGDLRIWRLGVGATGSLTPELFERYAGVTRVEVRQRTEAWIRQAYPRIKVLLRALAGMEDGRNAALVDFGTGPWVLTYDEVQTLVGPGA